MLSCVILLGIIAKVYDAAAADSLNAGQATARLSLAEADRQLLETNRHIRLARQAVRIASGEIQRVDVSPNPTLSATLSNTAARQYQWGRTNRVIGIEQLFERGGKRQLRGDLARDAELTTKAELSDVIRQQRIAMASAYFDLVAARQAVRIADDNSVAFERLVSALELRVNAGDAAMVDLARLQVEATRAANEARKAREQVADAQISLASALGVERLASQLEPTDDFPPLEDHRARSAASTLHKRIDSALVQRADVRAAQARIEAMNKAVALAMSQRSRDVTLGLYTEQDPAYGGRVFGLSASIPLMVNNDFHGEIARAQAELELAQENLARVRGVVLADIEHARIRLESAGERAARLDAKALPDAQKAVEAMEFAFSRGAASLTDLFDARRQLAATRYEAISNQADFAKALYAFELSLTIENIQ
jgi:cobalt-zinc-cadmium efflux system outer membrane protein